MRIKTITAILLALVCAGCAKKTTQTSGENVDVTKIYNLVILDRSGSMTPLREAAINGYNETLEVIRTAQQQYGLEQQNLVTLTLFNNIVTDVYNCETVQSIPYLLARDYQPDGMTAMLDAIGFSLMRLQKKLIKSESQARDIEKYLLPKIKIIIKERNQVKQLQERNIQMDINEIVEKGELCYEM